MANVLLATGSVGGSMSCFVIRMSDGYFYDAVEDNFVSTPPVATQAAMDLSERGSTGRFARTLPGGVLAGAASAMILVEYIAVASGSATYATAVVASELQYVNSTGTDTLFPGFDTSDIKAKLPSASAKMAGEGAIAKNLDQLAATQPRLNRPAGPGFQLKVSKRRDGTHKATAPVRVRAGTVGGISVSVDMRPLFGAFFVQTVGARSVSPSGAVTATEQGPIFTAAMITLAGTAAASETYVVTVPVTMETGELVNVDFDVESFAD